MSNRKTIISKINSFKLLKHNWNGYNAESIDIDIIIRSLDLINIFPNFWHINVFPTGRNTIQFEYETKIKYYEIEVYKNKYGVLYINNQNCEYSRFFYTKNELQKDIYNKIYK